MPLRYVSYKCITTPLALTSLGTPNLHSSRILYTYHQPNELNPNYPTDKPFNATRQCQPIKPVLRTLKVSVLVLGDGDL